MYWHEDCLKCGCCDCRLGEVGHSLYTKGNLLLCKRDYLRLFGSTGYCAACNKVNNKQSTLLFAVILKNISRIERKRKRERDRKAERK